jgi:RNA polymerase sigma-70 factor (ECF subfamily)
MTGSPSKLHILGLVRQSTDELMLLVQRGDALAFEELYRRMLPIIRRLLTSRSNNAALIDDALQEVFCRVWQHQGRFNIGQATAQTYLFGIALNVHREFSRHASSAPPSPTEIANIAVLGDRVSKDFGFDDVSHVLGGARVILSDRQSAAIGLVYDEGLRPREAAQRLGCTEKALRRLLEKARLRLYNHLRPQLRTTPSARFSRSGPGDQEP